MKNLFIFLTFILLLFCIPSLNAQNFSCLEKGNANLYFCDPLVNGSTIANRNGGSFVSEGWQITQNGNYLFYDLGTAAYKGRLSFWVKNIKLSNIESGDNHHLFEGRSIDSCNWQLENYFLTSLRTYSKVGENEPIFGRIKFEYGSTGECGGEGTVPGWDYNNWKPDKWYHIEMEFDVGYGRLIIDGNEMMRIYVNSSCPIGYRYFNIPIKWCSPSIEGINEAIYAYVSFYGYSKNAPVDAGPDILPDIYSPDAGENYETTAVIEDHSVHKWEPNTHPVDDTVLDVGADDNGDLDEGFYLKFNVTNIPDGYEVDEALIFLYCDYPQYPNAAEGGGGDIYFVEDNNWSEKTITWNNKPSFNPQKIDSQGIIKRGNWYRFDVSSVVKKNGIYSFAVMSYVKDGGHYLSKEGGANNGKVPYMRLHLVPASQNETLSDTGFEDVYMSDYISRDDLVYPDEYSDAENLPDFYSCIETSENFELYDYWSYNDSENIDALTDTGSDLIDADKSNLNKDAGSTSDSSDGCSCNLIE